MFIWYSQINKKHNQKWTYLWGSWSFGNDFARNVVSFGDGYTSSSHADNQKNKFLILGEGPTDGINDSTGAAEKIVLTLLRQTKSYIWFYRTMLMKVTCM